MKSVEDEQVTYSVYSALGGSILFRDEVSAGWVTDYISAGGAGVRLRCGLPGLAVWPRQQQTP